MRVKSSGIARGLGNARPPGTTKFANAPTPGTDKAGKGPAVAPGGLGGAGIDRCISQTSFGGETGGSVANCRLFSQSRFCSVNSQMRINLLEFLNGSSIDPSITQNLPQ